MSNWAPPGDTGDDEPVPNGGIRVWRGNLSLLLAHEARDSSQRPPCRWKRGEVQTMRNDLHIECRSYTKCEWITDA